MVGIVCAGACSGLFGGAEELRTTAVLITNQCDLFGGGAGRLWLGTLLGPEATGPFFAPVGVGVVVASHLVVGCGVCFVDSGCEHLASKALSCLFCNFCFLVFVFVSV